MSSGFSQFSASFARLSAVERRFIILVIVILFVVINLLFVLPYFSELGKIDNRFATARDTLDKFNKEIAQKPFHEQKVREMEGEGAAVPPEDQSVSFMTAIQNQAAQSGVFLGQTSRQPERTNQFFVERSLAYTTQSGESQLVDFLYNLGAGSSMIRVRALTIRTDAPRQALNANVTLIASYQRKVPRAATAAPKPPATTAPAAKPPTASTAPAAKPTTALPNPTPTAKPTTAAPTKTNRPSALPPTPRPSTPNPK